MNKQLKVILPAGLVTLALICTVTVRQGTAHQEEPQPSDAQQETPVAETSDTPLGNVEEVIYTLPPIPSSVPVYGQTTTDEADPEQAPAGETITTEPDGTIVITPDFEAQKEQAVKVVTPDSQVQANMGGGGGDMELDEDGVFRGTLATSTPAATPTPVSTPVPTQAPMATPTPAATQQPLVIPGEAYYIKERYEQNEDKSGYTCVESIQIYGEIGKQVFVSTKDYGIFHCNKSHPDSILRGTITDDNALVLKVFFDRDSDSSIVSSEPTQAPVEGNSTNEVTPTPAPSQSATGGPPSYDGSYDGEISPDGVYGWIGGFGWIKMGGSNGGSGGYVGDLDPNPGKGLSGNKIGIM